MLRPLGDRILIKPEKAPDQTESGLWLSEHRKPENMGTVVAVGPCPHPLKHEAEVLAKRLMDTLTCNADLWLTTEHEEDEALQLQRDAANLLLDVTRREPSVKVGDDVLFSWTVGQEIFVDDERYLLMREGDLLAVVESEPEHV